MRPHLMLIPAVAAAGFLVKDRAAKLAVGAARAATRRTRSAAAKDGWTSTNTAADWFGTAARERYGEPDTGETERKSE